MADVTETPKVRCDNCSKVDKKIRATIHPYNWVRPLDWGNCSVSATERGSYPNNIQMADLCPTCLKWVHGEVTKALELARERE